MFGGQDTFIIGVDSARRGSGIMGIGGAEMVLDADYNKYKHATQIGVIRALPIKINKNTYLYDTELAEGDTVLFHHFVCQPDHKVNIGEGFYRCEYFHIYARINMESGLEPIEDVIFVQPIEETIGDITFCGVLVKSVLDKVKQQGIVVAASKKAKAIGIKDGDKVFFTKSADYSMVVGAKVLYRMRIRNIVAVEREGAIVCLADQILVKNIPPVQNGILLNIVVSNQLQGAVVSVGENIKDINVGDKIAYYNGVNGSFKHNREEFSFLDVRHINYIIKSNMIQPVLNRVMIVQDEAQDKMGILEIPNNAKEKPRKGTVVSVGPGERNSTNGELIPMQVKVGDKVIYGEYASVSVKAEGKDYVITKESDLILILDNDEQI